MLKLKKRLFVAVFVILSILSVSIYLIYSYQFKNFQDEQFREISTSLNKLFDIRVQERHQGLTLQLERILDMKDLSKAIFEKDYKKIDSVIAPYFKELKVSNCDITILTFRDKDNITLYRAHKPELYGDVLNEKRKIIIDTSTQKKLFSGFEVGKLEITYRATKPIFYENEYVGNVEIGLNPKNILKGIDSVFKTDIGIAAENRYLNVMLDKNVVYIGDRHFLFSASETLENHFLHKDKESRTQKVDTSLILKNHLSQKIGFFVIGFDFRDSTNRYEEFMNRLFLSVVALMTIFAAILFLFFKRVYFTNTHALGNNALSDEIMDKIEEIGLTNEFMVSPKIAKIIKDAIKDDNVVPYFQPIVDAEGKIIKYEALMRIVNLQENQHKILLPYEFLEKSIKNDLYIDILKDMIRKGLTYFATREEKISINFLPDDLFNLVIMDEFIEDIKQFDSLQRVVVEISEKLCIENFSKLLKIAKKLKEIGVMISIDNFDGSYADNSHVLAIMPDYIKIKGSLIENITNDANSKSIVRGIVKFAKELNIKTVAEYVEDEETFELLKEYGLDEFQGYHFGYPTDLINKA